MPAGHRTSWAKSRGGEARGTLALRLTHSESPPPWLRSAPYCSSRPRPDALLQDPSPYFSLSAKGLSQLLTSLIHSLIHSAITDCALQHASYCRGGANTSDDGCAPSKPHSRWGRPTISKWKSKELQIVIRALTWSWGNSHLRDESHRRALWGNAI